MRVLLLVPTINKDERDEDGLTAADLAKDCGHNDCAEFIRNYKSPSILATVREVEVALLSLLIFIYLFINRCLLIH